MSLFRRYLSWWKSLFSQLTSGHPNHLSRTLWSFLPLGFSAYLQLGVLEFIIIFSISPTFNEHYFVMWGIPLIRSSKPLESTDFMLGEIVSESIHNPNLTPKNLKNSFLQIRNSFRNVLDQIRLSSQHFIWLVRFTILCLFHSSMCQTRTWWSSKSLIVSKTKTSSSFSNFASIINCWSRLFDLYRRFRLSIHWGQTLFSPTANNQLYCLLFRLLYWLLVTKTFFHIS